MGYYSLQDLPLKKPAEGVELRILHGERMTVAFFTLAAGSSVPEHAHDHEQIGSVLSGEMELSIGNEKRIVTAGQAYHIPSGVPHTGACLKGPAEVIEIFAPVREDWR
jgi:quercetin dioxygenase-like cupin family protein